MGLTLSYDDVLTTLQLKTVTVNTNTRPVWLNTLQSSLVTLAGVLGKVTMFTAEASSQC